MSTLTEFLKLNTSKIHAQTEKALNVKEVFTDTYSLDQFNLHLTKLFFAHSVINHIFSFSEKNNFALKILPKNHSNDLKTDLENFGGGIKIDCQIEIDASKLLDPASLIGISYVLRGSELGKAHISNALTKHLKKWGYSTSCYYSIKDFDFLLKDWKEWCNHVDNLEMDSDFYETALEAAKFTFDIFNNPEKYINTRNIFITY